MITSNKIECFAIAAEGRLLFAADNSGAIWTVEPHTLSKLRFVQAHFGNIHAIVVHRQRQLLAALGADRRVSIWSWDEAGQLSQIADINLRSFRAPGDPPEVSLTHSLSQALAFHPTRLRLATRSAGSALAEIDFDLDGAWALLHCTRVHDDEDLVTVAYAGGKDQLLSGSIRGAVALTERGRVKQLWRFGDRAVHWFEPLGGDRYLLASDMRYVVHLDIHSGEALVGPQFTRDDLEHVSFSPLRGTAFVTGFDRSIYEVDVATCEPRRVVCVTPFKCRWSSFLPSDPDKLIVHSFDGGLRCYSVSTGACTAALKDTPDAIWAGVRTGKNGFLFAGDGDRLLELTTSDSDAVTRVPWFEQRRGRLPSAGGYVKRAAFSEPTGLTICGRSDGSLAVLEGTRTIGAENLEEPVRDIVCDRSSPSVFVCTENGRIHKMSLPALTPEGLWESPRGQPLWAMDLAPDGSLLAVGERRGRLCLVQPASMATVSEATISVRPKRIKWQDSDRLLMNVGDKIDRLNVRSGERTPYLSPVGNTIEDFAWDGAKRYLVAVGYRCDVYLCDYETGELLDAVSDQIDYTKGVLFFEPTQTAYPLHFCTFGRSGCVHVFRVHNERIHPLGVAGTLSPHARNALH